MIYDDDIQAMKDIVDVCVGIPRFSYEMQLNAPRPADNYAAIKCASSVNPGFDETHIEVRNGEEVFVTRGIRILTFYILFSRRGSEYVKFDNSFFRPDVLAMLKSKGFAALDKTQLNLASTTLETNWEFREGIQMKFNVLREDVMPIGTMSDASVGGIFYDGNEPILIKGI